MNPISKSIVGELLRLAQSENVKIHVKYEEHVICPCALFKNLVYNDEITVCVFADSARQIDVVQYLTRGLEQVLNVPKQEHVLLLGNKTIKFYVLGEPYRFLSMLPTVDKSCEICYSVNTVEKFVTHACGAVMCSVCNKQLVVARMKTLMDGWANGDLTGASLLLSKKMEISCPRCRGVMTYEL